MSSLLTSQRKEGIRRALLTTTGDRGEVLVDERDGAQQLLMLELPGHVSYGITVETVGFRKTQIALGVQRGQEPVETVFEETLSDLDAARFLDTPMHLVGILVGQRSGAVYTLDDSP